MGGNIKFINKRDVFGERLADICVNSQKTFKPINCPVKLNSNAIDEFLIIFLLASKAYGVSNFKKLEELNKKYGSELVVSKDVLDAAKINTKQFSNEKIKIRGRKEELEIFSLDYAYNLSLIHISEPTRPY